MKIKNPYDCSACDNEDCFGCGEYAFEYGYDLTMSFVKKWGEEPCPHWISGDHNRRAKRLCHYCWQDFFKEVRD